VCGLVSDVCPPVIPTHIALAKTSLTMAPSYPPVPKVRRQIFHPNHRIQITNIALAKTSLTMAPSYPPVPKVRRQIFHPNHRIQIANHLLTSTRPFHREHRTAP